MKRKIAIILAAAVCVILTACILDPDLVPPLARETRWAFDPDTETYYAGYRTGEGIGWTVGRPEGGRVWVTVHLAEGYITRVELDLRTQSDGYRERVYEVLPGIIESSNSFNFSNLVVTGPTAPFTVRGVRDAGRDAMLQFPNVTEADLDF